MLSPDSPFPPKQFGGLIEAFRSTPRCRSSWAVSAEAIRRPSFEASRPRSSGSGPGRFPPKQFGGLIEASAMHARRGRSSGSFRRSNSAASLKLRCGCVRTNTARARFRRSNSAASLKHRLTARLVRDVTGFRRSNSAASLKQDGIVDIGWTFVLFPPKQFGGLIEAHSSQSLYSYGSSCFRRSKFGGLIEAHSANPCIHTEAPVSAEAIRRPH